MRHQMHALMRENRALQEVADKKFASEKNSFDVGAVVRG